ncbi:MAG: GntR family transcriptional regulator [Lachnospiraceae bacterium]|nr:GntR family transcriptional regulator [Lachnospiraceae bacterium]
MEKYERQYPMASTWEIIYHILRDDIISCRLLPGEKLKEEEYSVRFGCSRTTIRRSFEALLHENLLERQGGQSLRVVSLNILEQKEIMEVRLILEPSAARLAARSRTRRDLMTLESFLPLRPMNDRETLLQNDVMFHKAIFSATHNQHLIRLYQSLEDEISRSKQYTADDFMEFSAHVYDEHRRIFEAVCQGNENQAFKLSQLHVKMMLDSQLFQ